MPALGAMSGGRSTSSAGATAAGDVLPRLSELAALAITIFGEARNESPNGMIAVGQVVLHRRALGRWGRSVNSVVGARLQFSCWWPQGGAANYRRVLAVAEKVRRGEPVEELRPCLWVAAGLLDGAWGRDLVAGSTHYMTRELWLRKPPKWAAGVVPVASVDSHVFFAGVR